MFIIVFWASGLDMRVRTMTPRLFWWAFCTVFCVLPANGENVNASKPICLIQYMADALVEPMSLSLWSRIANMPSLWVFWAIFLSMFVCAR